MDVLISVVLLNLGAIPLCKKAKIKGSGAYFFTLCLVLMTIWVGALFDLLLPTAVFCVVAILCVNAYFFVRYGGKAYLTDVRNYFTLPVWFCNITCSIFTIIYAIQKPLFYYWDEYSFWGISAKIVKQTGRIYSIGQSTLLDMRSLPCGNSLLSYWFQLFSPDFVEYKLLLAYAFLYFAVFAVVAEVIIHYNANVKQGIVAYFALLLSPFLSVFHFPSADYTSLSYAYGTSMTDFTIPVMVLGVVAMYLIMPRGFWFLTPLAFLVTVKNTSIYFALIAGLVVCCMILFRREKDRAKIIKRLLACIFIMAIPIATFSIWNNHTNNSILYPTGATYNLSVTFDEPSAENPAPLATTSSDEITQERKASDVAQDLWRQFLISSSTSFASDKMLVAILIALGIGCIVFAEKGKRLILILINLGLFLGCVVYGLTLSYFIVNFSDGMVEYARYMTSYYFAWLYVIIMLFVLCVKGKELIAQAVLLCFGLIGCGTLYFLKVEYTTLAAPQNAYSRHIEIAKELALPKTVLTKNDRVLLVNLDQDTASYFYYRYGLMPSIVSVDTKNTGIDFSVNFRTSVKSTDERTYYNVASAETFTDVMRDYFDYIYVLEPDPEFKAGYGKLFSDGIQNKVLYKVSDDDKIPMQAVNYEN